MKLNPILLFPVLLVISACSAPAKPPPQQLSQTQANSAATSNAVPLLAAAQAQPASANKTAPAAASSQSSALPPASASRQSSEPSAALLAELHKKSVYFDFDQSAIKPEFLERVRQAANFLQTDSRATVVLEGHADERGSSEYNLALGERRANAVKDALRLSGISASRMQAVSLGEEKPRLTCAAEKCWQENRRVDFIFKSGL